MNVRMVKRMLRLMRREEELAEVRSKLRGASRKPQILN